MLHTFGDKAVPLLDGTMRQNSNNSMKKMGPGQNTLANATYTELPVTLYEPLQAL